MATLELVKNKKEALEKAEEYYNALCTNIQLSGENLKTVLLTSVQPNEGKSTTSTNLAISFAKNGYKTLLVDADTRNSVMTGTFKANGKIVGLTAYLSGKADLPTVLCETDIPNLTVIPSGQVPPNPIALFQGENFAAMMTVLKKYYDYVIIDTPPVGLVIDAAVIARHADATMLITAAGQTKRKSIIKAKEQLDQTGSQFLGVVLNKYDVRVENYGGYGGYGGYGSYGQYGQKSKKKKRNRKG